MRAAYYEKNGPARDVLKVGELDTPKPGPGEVRVRIATSGVNPSDVKGRAGSSRKLTVPRLVPHSDGAGEIDMVGEGVPASRVGERVWLWNAAWRRAFGTAAEYVALPSAQAVKLPDNASMEVGACMGIPALTAWHVVELCEAAPGVTVLAHGGAGSVGYYAVQFAKLRGATVIATVSSDAKAELARGAGADHVIDYKREDVGARVQAITGGRGVDATLEVDMRACAPLWPQVLRKKGSVILYGTGASEVTIPASFVLQGEIAIKPTLIYDLADAERTRANAEVTRLLERDGLRHLIGPSYPLDEIVAAHEAMETGAITGKILLKLR